MSLLRQLHSTLGVDGVIYVIVLATAMLVAFAATPLARRLAMRHGATDNPGGRRIHKRITARLGGLAVFTATAVGTVTGLCLWTGADIEQLLARNTIVPVLLIGGMVCLFGALDDLQPMSPIGKLAGLSSAGLLLGMSGIRIDYLALPMLGQIELGWFAIPMTILWVLACTNAVNLIDGVDGCGAGVVTISALTMMLFCLGLGDFAPGLLFAATCGGACGFLIHNRQPASIFLGDSGSLLLGFLLAAISAAGCTGPATSLVLAATLVALAVPFLDATQSFVRRFRATWIATRPEPGRGRLFLAIRATAVADRSHIHHRLLFRGLAHSEVALIICMVTMVTSMVALLFLPTGRIHWSTLVTALVVGGLVLARLGWIQPFPERRTSQAQAETFGETSTGSDADPSEEEPTELPRPTPAATGPQGMGSPPEPSPKPHPIPSPR